MADAARSEPMLHPSRGGGGRPHEGHAQARRELQRSYLEARRIENKRPKISCASRPGLLRVSKGRLSTGVSLMRQNTLGPAAPLVAALAQLIPIALISDSLPACRQAACRSQEEPTQGLSYGRAGGFSKVMESTARFMRPAGQAAARQGFPSLKSIVPWPCLKVTVPRLLVTVTSPFRTMTS